MPFSRAITDTSVSSSFGHPTWIGHIILASLVYALMDETTLGLCSSALELLFNLEMRCLMTQRTECKQMLWIDHSTVVLTCQCSNDSYTKNKELPATPFSSIMSNRAKCVQTRSSLDERQFVKVMIEGARVCVRQKNVLIVRAHVKNVLIKCVLLATINLLATRSCTYRPRIRDAEGKGLSNRERW